MAGAGIRCGCTPPPNAKELGACCYTEEIDGILYPQCEPNLTEEECSSSLYPNSAFSAGLDCGARVPCSLAVDLDGPKAIKNVFAPKSRFSAYCAPFTTTDIVPENNNLDYRDFFSGLFTTIGGARSVISLSNRGTNARISESLANHEAVNYFFFVTNDNTLYLCITLDNFNQQLLDDTIGTSSFYVNLQTRIFKIQDNFTTDNKDNITASDNFSDIPMLFWTEGENSSTGESVGTPNSLLGRIYNTLGPFWSAYAKNLQHYNAATGSVRGYDYFDNAEILAANVSGRKLITLSTKYGGRITGITTFGTVVQGGHYSAGAAVGYFPEDNSSTETFGLRFLPSQSSGEIETEPSPELAQARLESRDSQTQLDPRGINGSNLDLQTYGPDNFRRIAYYNRERAFNRVEKVKSIRNAVKIEENFFATAVLTSTGSIYTWGDPLFGGDDYYQKFQRISNGYQDFLLLNSQNQQTENATDYTHILPLGKGFIGFKSWDGSNNNVTFFGSFNVDGSSLVDPIGDYEAFLGNGKRYRAQDAILLNDGGVILKAYQEDHYTVVGGRGGRRVVQGSFTSPLPGLTIKKALCADQRFDVFRNDSSLYLVLWSDERVQAISFSPILASAEELEADPTGGLNNNVFTRDWIRFLDEEALNTRVRTLTGPGIGDGALDIFLLNQSYGFGYILRNPDGDGFNTVLVLRRGFRINQGLIEFYNENSGFDLFTPGALSTFDGFNFNYDKARQAGGDVEDIYTNVYTNIDGFGFSQPVDTGFTRVRFKDIDFATSSCADPYSEYGPDIDALASNNATGEEFVRDAKQNSFVFSSAFLHTRAGFNTQLAEGESNIIGIHWRKPQNSPFGDRPHITESTIVRHTRVNPVDSETEDAGSALFNFDYINLFVNHVGQVLSSPGIQYTNDSSWSDSELFLVGEANGASADKELSINNTRRIETYSNCADSICIICGGISHKCNAETGECFECIPFESNINTQGIPLCSERPDIYPWSQPILGICFDSECSIGVRGCCCASYQRSPEEPVWFEQAITTIDLPSDYTQEELDFYLTANGCFGQGAEFYYDGTQVPYDEIDFTFTPFDDEFTEINCGAEFWDAAFTQTCSQSIFDGANSAVSVNSISINEPCDLNIVRDIDITFKKRIVGIRCRVDYNIPSINEDLQALGCSQINDAGSFTFLENEYEKTITISVCCELLGTYNVNYTVTPVE